MAVLLVSPVASADVLTILGPEGPVTPDGFLVAVVRRDERGALASAGDVELEARGAQVRIGPADALLKSYWVLPHQDSRSVTLLAHRDTLRASSTFAIGPPVSKVELSLEGAPPVKGKDTSARIDVRVLREDGTADAELPAPVLHANVGTIEPLVQVSPGHYQTRFVLPSTRYPEVAVVVAFAPWPHPGSIHGTVGSLLVPLASAIDLPGRTEPNAQMSIDIAGTTFGPVRAAADGRFELPVIVPPGHRFGEGVAVDRAGNRRNTRIDLMLPPTDQLACVMNPRRLPADGVSRARVVCAATDPYGHPQGRAKLEVRASAGDASPPRRVGAGLYEWIFTAPSIPSEGVTKLASSFRDGRNLSREVLDVALVQGPAAKLEIERQDEVVHRGGRTTLAARVTDALGRPRSDAVVDVDVPDGKVKVRPGAAPGEYEITWRPPEEGGDDEAALAVRAFGPAGDAPAHLRVWAKDGFLFASVTDLAGWPVPGQVLRIGERRWTTGPDGVAHLGPLRLGAWTVRHAEWPSLSSTVYVLDTATSRIFPEGSAIGTSIHRVRYVLAPPVPVNVQLRVQGREVRYWAEDPEGALLADRPLTVRVDGAKVASRRMEEGRVVLTLEEEGPAQITVADAATGITAVAQVPSP